MPFAELRADLGEWRAKANRFVTTIQINHPRFKILQIISFARYSWLWTDSRIRLLVRTYSLGTLVCYTYVQGQVLQVKKSESESSMEPNIGWMWASEAGTRTTYLLSENPEYLSISSIYRSGNIEVSVCERLLYYFIQFSSAVTCDREIRTLMGRGTCDTDFFFVNRLGSSRTSENLSEMVDMVVRRRKH
jgi:hypothetical protein